MPAHEFDSVVRISPTRSPNSVAGIFLTRSPYFAAEIFPSQSPKFTALLMGQTPTQKRTLSSTLLLGFPHSEAKILQVPLMGLTPLGNNTVCLSNHSQNKLTTPMLEISTPKRHDHINFIKLAVKQAREDLNKQFHSKDIYICFTTKSYSILNTFIQDIFDYI